MPGPAPLRLLAALAIGIMASILLIQGLNMVACAAVRQAEIDAGHRVKFVVVGER